MKSLLKYIIGFTIVFTMTTLSLEYVSAAKIKGTRVKEIYQEIDGKDVVLGCNQKNCAIHKDKRYGKKCVTGSDLFQIRVPVLEKRKIKYKTVKSRGYTSMQGGGIDGDSMYVMFSKKPDGKGKNKTAIAEIDLSNNKVIKAEEVYGVGDVKFKELGHANDFALGDKYYHIPWYQTDGKKTYTSKMGYIGIELSNDGKAKITRKAKKKVDLAIFGAADTEKGLAFGFRKETFKDKKKKKSLDIQRTVELYSFKNKKYKRKKKLFDLEKNKNYPITQCMEYSKKLNKYYVVRYREKGNGHNNCIEIYNKKGKYQKKYIVKDPSGIKECRKNGKSTINVDINTKSMRWEIESLCYYKNNKFYYTQYRPEKKKKMAYLYYATIK